MPIITVNGQSVKLSKNDFIAQGGEGEIYVKGNTAYKLYIDPQQAITDAKISELGTLSDQHIIKPQDPIYDNHNNIIGFTMEHLINTIPMVKLFTNGFRRQNQITPEMTLNLVEAMQTVIQSIHDHQILIVDGNEMNYLVDEADLTTPYFIDVDSYQTQNYPAKVIMPSIRDWHSKTFSTLTDWFSFAIIACQLFIGIHPYKGKHPNFKKHDLQARMLKNVSIFNAETSVPPTTRDLSNIPQAYLTWFTKLFEQGKRLPPPLIAGTLKPIQKSHATTQSKAFIIVKIQRYQDTPLYHHYYRGNRTIVTEQHIVQSKTTIKRTASNDKVVFSPNDGALYVVTIEDRQLTFQGPDKHTWQPLQAEDFMTYNNIVYAKHLENLIEIQILTLGQRTLINATNKWHIMPNSSQLFAGMVYQNVLGRAYLSIPYKPKHCANLPVPELDCYQIITAKYESNVAVLIGFKDQSYTRITLVFTKDHRHYQCRTQQDIDYKEINFTVLDNGIVLSITDDGSMELFKNQETANPVTELHDPIIQTNMQLTHENNTAMFLASKELYQLSMTQPTSA